MAGNRKYDISNVAAAYGKNQLPDRHDLLREFYEAVEHNLPLIGIMKQISLAAVQNKSTPLQVLQMSIAHGMALGVFLEQDRQKRIKTN